MTSNPAALMFYDSAWPPPPGKEPKTDGVCFYVFGDTPHIWTTDEIHRQAARFRLPIVVRSNPAGADPRADVAGAIEALVRIGVPRGRLVGWDIETAIDPAYAREVVKLMAADGWPVIFYGSKSTLFANHVPDKLYWAADWTQRAHLSPGSSMTQFASYRAYDLDLALPILPFWDTQPPTTPPMTDWQDAAMQALPTTAEGASGPAVRTAQALALARGYTITVDGIFGADTAQAVRHFQLNNQLAPDGVVGPKTWPALMGVA